jgi:uncharacterized protein (TIGR03118 family)
MRHPRSWSRRAALACTCVAALGAGRAEAQGYHQTNLVSDIPGVAAVTDPNLVNPWGLAVGPQTFLWAADNESGVSTLYDGAGHAAPPGPAPLVVTIPPPAGGTIAAPTGIVFNGTGQFLAVPGNAATSSLFIFATEDGTISAWGLGNPDLTQAILEVDGSTTGASFTGLALASNANGSFLYAANFGQRKIDVFDSSFAPATLGGTFTDPDLPPGFAPFGIQAIGSSLYVTYAMQDRGGDEVTRRGLGVVDVFDTNGNFMRRLATNGTLDAPWGVALAPADFGELANDVLVGNFGDGRISAFDSSGAFRGLLSDVKGKAIEIPGLWGLTFGNGNDMGGPANALFFAAGVAEEHHGLFGSLTVDDGQGRGR